MTLLREIQQAATDKNTDVTTLLRKAKVLAARLKNAAFAEWVNRELNGYPRADKEALPPYRILKVESKAHLMIGWNQMPHATVMSSQIPERFREWATTAYLWAPISEYASLSQAGVGTLESPWPQELAVEYAANGYNEAQCIKAWQVISVSSLIGVIEIVKTKILDFVLDLETEAPSAGEVPPGEASPLPQERITQIFNMNISGGVSNIAAASSQVTQSQSGLMAGDWDALESRLERLGVREQDIGVLKHDLAEHGASKETVRGWLGTLAMSGVTTLATDGVKHAAEAIAAYMGWK